MHELEIKFHKQAMDVTARFVSASKRVCENMEAEIQAITGGEKLLTPEWLQPDRRTEACRRLDRLAKLIDVLTESFKRHNLAYYQELTEIDCGLEQGRRRELLQKHLIGINNAARNPAALLALTKQLFQQARVAFKLLEHRGEFVHFENGEILFTSDEAYDAFMLKMQELTETHDEIKRLHYLDEERLLELGERIGIYRK